MQGVLHRPEEHRDVVHPHPLAPPARTGLFVAVAACAAAVAPLGAAGASARALPATAAAACTKGSIAPAVARAGKAQGTTAKLGKPGFRCADGWAYAFADLGPSKHAIAVTFVFKSTGGAWVTKNRASRLQGARQPGSRHALQGGLRIQLGLAQPDDLAEYRRRMTTRVLVLGAGFGGLELATMLSEALGR